MFPLLSGERIKAIDGFPGYYVTDHGRVFSEPRVTKPGYKLFRGTLHKGYTRIALYADGVKTFVYVHVLVARAFIPNPDDLPEVNHKDGVKTNCHFSNLEWSTSLANQQHALATGLRHKYTSVYYGVTFFNSPAHWRKPWRARAKNGSKMAYIGGYGTELEAARAYNAYVLQHKLPCLLNEGI